MAIAIVWAVLFAVYSPGGRVSGTGGSPPASPGPSLDPGNIPVTGVTGSLVAGPGASPNVTFVGGSNLCPTCPLVPVTDYSLNPAGVRLIVFFNLTNSGSVPYNVGPFALNASGSVGAQPFALHGVLCCDPLYDEDTDLAFLTAGMTLGFEAVFVAPSIPSSGPSGYHLTLEATYVPA